MRTTTSGRAFAKVIFDLFSTLMVSLPIETHKILFKSYPNSFTADEAIANLGGLQFIQSNRDTDPKDPTRIITHVVTTQFSLSRDMAKNLCQTFMDARLFENASDPNKREFQNKGIYQVTGKGAHILDKFVHRNALPVEETRHITANATPKIVALDRADDEDAIILTQRAVDAIFKRFAGPAPNVATRTGGSPGDSPLNTSPGRDRPLTALELCNGIEVKDQQHNYDIYKHTFYGKAAVEWLLDYTTVISKEEAIHIAQEMVNCGFIEQVGEENRSGQLFKTANSSLYHLTEVGRAHAGWESLVPSRGSSINNDWMEERASGNKPDRGHSEVKLLSAQFKLTSHSLSRLPISVAHEKRMSADEVSLSGSPYSEDTGRGSIRRLSQILNDPAFQITLSESGAMSSYAASSSGRESVGMATGGAHLSGSSSSLQPTASNTTRLNIILSNSTLRDLFKSFLKQNICEENLSFYFEVLDYKSKFSTLINSTRAYWQSLPAQGQDPAAQPYPATLRELEKQICTQAFAIHETYLASGAPREVNLPHQMRSDITAYMQAVVRNMDSPDGSTTPATPRNLASAPSSPSSTSAETGDHGDKSIGAQGRELIHISLFDGIHEHIFRLMSTDSVPKFTKTDKYREVMMSRVKQGSAAVAGGMVASSDNGITNGNSGPPSGNNTPGARSPTTGPHRNEAERATIRRSLSLNDHYTLQNSQLSTKASQAVASPSPSMNSSAGSIRRGYSTQQTSPSPPPIPSPSIPTLPPPVATTSSALIAASPPSLQLLRTPRVRSASTNAPLDGLKAQQLYQQARSSLHSMGGSSSISSTSLNGGSGYGPLGVRVPRHSSSLSSSLASSSHYHQARSTHQQVTLSAPSASSSALQHQDALSSSKSKADQVVVLFESTSFAIQDQHPQSDHVHRQQHQKSFVPSLSHPSPSPSSSSSSSTLSSSAFSSPDMRTIAMLSPPPSASSTTLPGSYPGLKHPLSTTPVATMAGSPSSSSSWIASPFTKPAVPAKDI